MAQSVISNPNAPVQYTSYTAASGFSLSDAAYSRVFIIGKLCVFSINLKAGSDITPGNLQPLVTNMPKGKTGMMFIGMASTGSRFRPFRFTSVDDGNGGWLLRTHYPMIEGNNFLNGQAIILTGSYELA